MKSKITMYEVTHKKVDFIPNGRTPIFVGNGENLENYLSDNTGDNISIKNKNYCELTAMYWIWKNDKESDFVSIEHYRRFFMKNGIIVSQKKILKDLCKSDIITSKTFKFSKSIFEYYKEHHFSTDIEIIRNIILEKYPCYLSAFDNYFESNESCMLNMVACKKNIFDEYCVWLFDILFELEQKIDISDRDLYQSRVYGFLSERLLNVWLLEKKYKIKKYNIFYLKKHKISSWFYSIYKGLK